MCFSLDFGCLAKAGAGAVASKGTNSFLDEVRKSAADATTTILKTLGTFWLNIPSPKVPNLAGPGLTGAAAPTNLQAAGPAGVLQGNLGYLTILAAVVGLILESPSPPRRRSVSPTDQSPRRRVVGLGRSEPVRRAAAGKAAPAQPGAPRSRSRRSR